MNCHQIQEQLSQYLDHRLDDKKRSEIEDHLAACAHCLPEAKRLSDGIKGVAGLPEIDPPAGFSQRVMTRIRSEKEKPALWSRLFQPLWVKIPLHAAGVLLTVGLGVYLFSLNEPIQMEMAPPVPSEPAPSNGAKTAEPRKEESAPMIAAPSEAGPAPEALGRRKSAAPEQGAPDIVLTLHPKGPADQTAVLTTKIKQAAERSRGKLFALIKEPDPESAKLNFWLNLPSSEYDRFKTELSRLGTVLSESRPAGTAPRSGIEAPSPIQVKLTFLFEDSKETGPPAPPAPPQK